jgi:hypothetical protein
VTRKRLIWLGAIVALLLVAALFTRGMGFTSRTSPWPLEGTLMRGARSWATPDAIRRQPNPVPPTSEAIRAGMEHWADHCAVCHGNDGSGDVPIGRNLYPRAPDMRSAVTQGMTDGELFYVIERGIQFTGMPAWGTGTADGEKSSWELVLFIRHLRQLTEVELEEMEGLNPVSPAQMKHSREIDDFLSGGKKRKTSEKEPNK